MAEDMLTELYAWDSEIEDVSALATDDPKRDDDKAEDAYEKIIHAASVDDANDVVLSLAAQLLHKHFFHFPHVQLNVVDVLLKLCESKRSQAVRIHTLRALLQIVKTPPATAIAPTPTSASSVAHIVTRTWMLRIEENVIQMLDNEKSPVILRQVTPLRQALEERLQQVLSQSSINAADNDKNINMSPPLEQSRKHLRDVTQANDGVFSAERENKKPKFDDESSGLQSNRGKIVQLNRDWSNAHDNSNEDTSSWKEKTLSDRIVENEGRRPKFSAQSPRNCPPCPYLFLGSLPRHTPSADIVEFLSPISAEIDTMKVQIKEPDFNANAYAFISMPTIEHARLAIHFVNENKFQGRNYLNANFARGPPVDTLLFVERTADNVRMEDKDAVRDFDFTKCDPDVWNDLCQQLEQFGPLTFAEKGCVRFRNVEHAKAAIRKQLFTVMGYSILPVYDIKEQFAIDSTRRGFNAQKKQGFALKSGRLVGGDDDDRSKNTYYREDETFMDGPNGRREHDQVMSLKYDERSSLRNDRESFRGRSRSPKVHHSSGRYDAPMIGMTRERRAPRSRSHSPVMQSKPGAGDGGYGTFSDKENYRELQSKYAHRSPSPIDNRSHERSVFDEEIRGRSHGRGISWMEPRPMESSRKHRELPEEVQSHRSSHRGGFPSPSFGSRHSRKNESGKQRSSDYRHNSEDVRQSYRRGEPMLEGCGKMQPPSPNSALQLSRSHSRSPPRFSKYGGSSRSRPRSRSRSPHIGISMESSVSQRSGGNRGHEKRSIGMHLPDERLSLPAERPRYADERSIAEVARDEQQERQRFFQQQSQGRRDNHDADLSRYGSGSVIGQSGSSGRGGKFHAQQPLRAAGEIYRQEVVPPQPRSHSPHPPPKHYRSLSPLSQNRRRTPSPLRSSQQQRESYRNERFEDFEPRGSKAKAEYSPPRSPTIHSINHRPEAPSDFHEYDLETDNLRDRHERRRYSRHTRSRDEKDHRNFHRDHHDERLSHPEQSLTPSSAHERASGSGGRKSSVLSPHRALSRRDESDNGPEETYGGNKQSQSKNEDGLEPQQMETKNGGSRMARDELFAGMDDLTVDYEEDDE